MIQRTFRPRQDSKFSSRLVVPKRAKRLNESHSNAIVLEDARWFGTVVAYEPRIILFPRGIDMDKRVLFLGVLLVGVADRSLMDDVYGAGVRDVASKLAVEEVEA